MTDNKPKWKSELVVFAVLFAFGLLALPALVYLVGLEVVGAYEGPDGIWSLYAAILAALARGAIAAWLLVLSPYVVIQLLRVLAALHRARRP